MDVEHEAVAEGVDIALHAPSIGEWYRFLRALGRVSLAAALILSPLCWATLDVGLAVAILVVLAPPGAWLWGAHRNSADFLRIGQHRVQLLAGRSVVKSFPLHAITAVSTFEEQLVLHTSDGDEHLWMVGRDPDACNDVAIAVEQQLEAARDELGAARVPRALDHLRA